VGWFQKLSEGLSKTRDAVTGQLDRLLGRAADPALLDELEVALISADLGMPVVDRVMEGLRAQMRGGNFSAAEKVRELLRQSVLDILLPTQAASIDQLIAQGPRPFVILAVGVNGVGKTTTVAKLTQRFRQQGHKALLVAGDTFRAAAIDQLQVWADRVQVDIIRHRPGADPAAVAYDGITEAKAIRPAGCIPKRT
jgi:fused signal recognition particle receptor